MKSFYKDKKVLVTGSSGFVGSWLCMALNHLEANVHGISLLPNTNPSIFKVLKLEELIDQQYIDINNRNEISMAIQNISPDIVFHLAAQPLVRESYHHPLETFNTNIIGALNVLDSCSLLSSTVNFISITTDKCYENNETGQRFIETDPMGGKDPYSASKACTEIVTKSYALSFNDQNNLKICTARGGNIIGGGDWSKDRIITDIITSLTNKRDILLRSPNSIRPWQHVVDVIAGYLRLGVYNQKKDLIFDSFNFGPSKENEINVMELSKMMIAAWKESNSSILVEKENRMPEADILRLDSNKAKQKLNWKPAMSIEETISNTSQWYRSFYNSPDGIFELTLEQISSYIDL